MMKGVEHRSNSKAAVVTAVVVVAVVQSYVNSPTW